MLRYDTMVASTLPDVGATMNLTGWVVVLTDDTLISEYDYQRSGIQQLKRLSLLLCVSFEGRIQAALNNVHILDGLQQLSPNCFKTSFLWLQS